MPVMHVVGSKKYVLYVYFIIGNIIIISSLYVHLLKMSVIHGKVVLV